MTSNCTHLGHDRSVIARDAVGAGSLRLIEEMIAAC